MAEWLDAEELRASDQAVARGWMHLPEAWGEQVITQEAEPRASMSTPQGQLPPGGNTGQSNHSPSPCPGPPGPELYMLVTRILSPVRTPLLTCRYLSLPGSDSQTQQGCPWGYGLCTGALGPVLDCW